MRTSLGRRPYNILREGVATFNLDQSKTFLGPKLRRFYDLFATSLCRLGYSYLKICLDVPRVGKRWRKPRVLCFVISLDMTKAVSESNNANFRWEQIRKFYDCFDFEIKDHLASSQCSWLLYKKERMCGNVRGFNKS